MGYYVTRLLKNPFKTEVSCFCFKGIFSSLSNILHEVKGLYYWDIFFVGLFVGSLLFYNILKYTKSWSIKRKLAKAKRAEKKAADLLRKAGYKITGIQVRVPITTWIDDKPYQNYVKADFLAKKYGKIYVVEVKTGDGVNPVKPETRRQLLEYYLVFKPHGILLMDMEENKIKEIGFTYQNHGKYKTIGFLLLISGIIGLVIGWNLFKYLGGA